MYAVLAENFDPSINSVWGPFDTRLHAEEWARQKKHLFPEGFIVEELCDEKELPCETAA